MILQAAPKTSWIHIRKIGDEACLRGGADSVSIKTTLRLPYLMTACPVNSEEIRNLVVVYTM